MRKTLEKASKIATLSLPAKLRKFARIQQTVTNAQKDIDLVLIGQKKWTPVQFNLYKLLLNKIVPDISTTYVEQNDKTTRRISGLSRQELEEMVAERLVASTKSNNETLGKPPFFDDQTEISDSDTAKNE